MPTVVRMLAAAPLAVGLAAACLPDLERLPELGPGDSGEVPLLATCGDDLISAGADGGAGESCDPGDASVPGCVSCRITCEGSLDEISRHCYFRAGDDDTFAAASQRCLGANAHLVTIGGEREAALVDALTETEAYWIGLSRDVVLGAYVAASRDEPGYPLAPTTGPCPGCFGRGDDGGAFADLDEGVDAGDAGIVRDCLASAEGRWGKVPCAGGAPRITMCEREPPGLRLESCGGVPCLTVRATEPHTSYLLFTTPATGDEAAGFCASLGTSLVTFETREEREALARELAKLLRDPRLTASPPLTFWVGLQRGDGGFVWDDGIPADDAGRPPSWGDRQPAGGSNRAFLSLRQQVYDSQLLRTEDEKPADAARAFVCKKAR